MIETHLQHEQATLHTIQPEAEDKKHSTFDIFKNQASGVVYGILQKYMPWLKDQYAKEIEEIKKNNTPVIPAANADELTPNSNNPMLIDHGYDPFDSYSGVKPYKSESHFGIDHHTPDEDHYVNLYKIKNKMYEGNLNLSEIQLNSGNLSESDYYLNMLSGMQLNDNGGASELAEDKPLESIKTKEQEIVEVINSTWKTISEQLGSSRDGWYEDPVSKEKCHVRFYESEDQMAAKWLANQIYKVAGTEVPIVTIEDVNGEKALVTREVNQATGVYADELQNDTRFKESFIVDAFLGNWDVVGLTFENVLKDNKGQYVRTNNGGSIMYEGQNNICLPPDSIEELDTMRNPSSNSGKIFGSLSDVDLKSQAQDFINTLSVSKIKKLVESSNLSTEAKKKIEKSLIGRRNVLIERFQLKEKEKSDRLGLKIIEIKDYKDGDEGYSKGLLRADGRSVENHAFEIYNKTNKTSIYFKLVPEKYKEVYKKLVQLDEVKIGALIYDSVKENQYIGSISNCLELVRKGITIRLGLGNKRAGSKNLSDSVMSVVGLVNIDIPTNIPVEDAEEIIEGILENLFDIQNPLQEPSNVDEDAYKIARYCWKYKIDANTLTPEQREEIAKLSLQEVGPNYTTYVEIGKSEELEKKYGRFTGYHSIYRSETVTNIIRSGGLLCTHERYKKGWQHISGMSSTDDLVSGGADNVFVRTVVESEISSKVHIGATYSIIFKNDIYDRTDWFSYGSDMFGSVRPEVFMTREDPDTVFKPKLGGSRDANEQMFRNSIGITDFAGITCPTIEARVELIEKLHNVGITHINGSLIEDYIFVGIKQSDMFFIQEHLKSTPEGKKIYRMFLGANVDNTERKPEIEILKKILSQKHIKKFIKIITNSHERDLLQKYTSMIAYVFLELNNKVKAGDLLSKVAKIFITKEDLEKRTSFEKWLSENGISDSIIENAKKIEKGLSELRRQEINGMYKEEALKTVLDKYNPHQRKVLHHLFHADVNARYGDKSNEVLPLNYYYLV